MLPKEGREIQAKDTTQGEQGCPDGQRKDNLTNLRYGTSASAHMIIRTLHGLISSMACKTPTFYPKDSWNLLHALFICHMSTQGLLTCKSLDMLRGLLCRTLFDSHYGMFSSHGVQGRKAGRKEDIKYMPLNKEWMSSHVTDTFPRREIILLHAHV